MQHCNLHCVPYQKVIKLPTANVKRRFFCLKFNLISNCSFFCTREIFFRTQYTTLIKLIKYLFIKYNGLGERKCLFCTNNDPKYTCTLETAHLTVWKLWRCMLRATNEIKVYSHSNLHLSTAWSIIIIFGNWHFYVMFSHSVLFA